MVTLSYGVLSLMIVLSVVFGGVVGFVAVLWRLNR